VPNASSCAERRGFIVRRQRYAVGGFDNLRSQRASCSRPATCGSHSRPSTRHTGGRHTRGSRWTVPLPKHIANSAVADEEHTTAETPVRGRRGACAVGRAASAKPHRRQMPSTSTRGWRAPGLTGALDHGQQRREQKERRHEPRVVLLGSCTRAKRARERYQTDLAERERQKARVRRSRLRRKQALA
jgi:hypothetical protein